MCVPESIERRGLDFHFHAGSRRLEERLCRGRIAAR
jgi:hypothetical protein